MSQEIDDIIENAPGWLLRSGITVIGITTLVVISLSALIRYPDKIICSGIMSSDNPPIAHRGNVEGVIDSLYVKHNTLVQAGTPLLLIQNPCRTGDLIMLIRFIGQLEPLQSEAEYLNMSFPQGLQLGELQKDYAQLENRFYEFALAQRDASLKRQSEIIRNEILRVEQLTDLLIKQKQIRNKELKLIRKENQRNNVLYKERVISDSDMEKSEREVLTYEKQVLSLENEIVESQIRKEQLTLEETRLKKEIIDFESKSILAIREIISIIKQGIKVWEEKYVVTAKITGVVSFDSKVIAKSRLAPQDIVANIIPPTKPEVMKKFVRANSLEASGIGKIEIGDKVILKLHDYPYREYGISVSHVSSVSLLPKEDKNGVSNYEFVIPVPDTIETSYKYSIPYRPNTLVTVEIITSDRSLLQRVFNTFSDLIKNV